MNAQLHAYQDYTLTSPIKSQKDIECDIILEVTRTLKTAEHMKGSDYRQFARAVHINRKLWTILAADVANSSNALPPDLRAKIFYLGEFVQQHSGKVLREDEPVTPLIEINLAILRGLGMGGVQQ